MRQLGATQILVGAEDDAEKSLLRVVRLGCTSTSQGKVNKTSPRLVESLLPYPLGQVTCGWSHTVGLTATSKVSRFTFEAPNL